MSHARLNEDAETYEEIVNRGGVVARIAATTAASVSCYPVYLTSICGEPGAPGKLPVRMVKPVPNGNSLHEIVALLSEREADLRIPIR
jgi:hypothetical protein